MKKWIMSSMLGLATMTASAAVTVSNVSVAQHPGTKLVDIFYDVSSTATNAVTVSLSVHNGAAEVSAPSVSGAVGAGVTTGTGKSMVWNMGTDWNGNVATLIFSVMADDGQAPAMGDYLVIDLSGGTGAVSYPVTYLNAVPQGGWTTTYKTTKLVMRKIPMGTFTMGARFTDYPRVSFAQSLRTVTLTKDFYIGVFEVTQQQWELVMGNKPSYFNYNFYYASRPVEQVSYYEIRENPANSDDPVVNWPTNSAVNATSFMGRLRAKTGLTSFDLPTDSQWEYACRAGTITALNLNMNLSKVDEDTWMSAAGRYWYNGGSGFTQNGSVNVGTAEVGSHRSNSWGLYDMHGNVNEWCLDKYEQYPVGTVDPSGAVSGAFRVFRGGGWASGAASCCSGERYDENPSNRRNSLGFRVARTLP